MVKNHMTVILRGTHQDGELSREYFGESCSLEVNFRLPFFVCLSLIRKDEEEKAMAIFTGAGVAIVTPMLSNGGLPLYSYPTDWKRYFLCAMSTQCCGMASGWDQVPCGM